MERIFDWDPKKNARNKRDHDNVSFEEAMEIFQDPLQLNILDTRYDYGEERWRALGSTKNGRILLVAYVYVIIDGVEADGIRIISARKATKSEKRTYETQA